MKTQFSPFWKRLTGAGVRLTPFEERLLCLCRERLPQAFGIAMDAQLAAYNLAQRQIDWRAINLYRVQGSKIVRTDLPPLPCSPGEVKLLSLAILAGGTGSPVHVVYWAVDRYFFGFSTGESMRPLRQVCDLRVLKVTQSWRSNLDLSVSCTPPPQPASNDAG